MGGLMTAFLRVWEGFHESPSQEDMEAPFTDFVAHVKTAVDKGDFQTLLLLQEEATVNLWGRVEYLKTSPPLLHRAVANSQVDIVRYLIDNGADTDVVDNSRMTALHVACKNKDTSLECFQLLLDKTADLEKWDAWGRTPLLKAIIFGNMKATLLLLEKGANPNVIDFHGITPLSTALNHNDMDLIYLLAHHGANLNRIVYIHERPAGPALLQAAVKKLNKAMVSALLSLGASTAFLKKDIVYPRNYNDTPFSTNFRTRTPSGLMGGNSVTQLAIAKLLELGSQQNMPDRSYIDQFLDILMVLLSANGVPMHATPPPRVLQGILDPGTPKFHQLLLKMDISSTRSYYEMWTSDESPRQDGDIDTSAAIPRPKSIMTLEDQSRKVARQALMSSGHNVLWATERLQCPPALKKLLLLKDLDFPYPSPKPVMFS